MEHLMIESVLTKIYKKMISVEPLFKNSEVVLVLESNNAGLKKLSSFV
jgi:hypothetical protein